MGVGYSTPPASSAKPLAEPIGKEWVFVPKTEIVDVTATFSPVAPADAPADAPVAPVAPADAPAAPVVPADAPAAPPGALLAQIIAGKEALMPLSEGEETNPRKEGGSLAENIYYAIRARRLDIEQSMTSTGDITDSWLK